MEIRLLVLCAFLLCVCIQVAIHPEEGHSYRATPMNRWACDDEGGKAYPISLLCYPSNMTGFPTDCDDDLVYYLDAWASPPNDDTWYDLSGVNTDHPAVWTQVMTTSPAVRVVSFVDSMHVCCLWCPSSVPHERSPGYQWYRCALCHSLVAAAPSRSDRLHLY